MIENAVLANDLYWGCYALGFLAIFLFNAVYAKRYSISAKKGLLYTVVSYAMIYLWAYFLAWVINGFRWGHHNAIRVYIWFPLILFLLQKPFRIPFKTACEYMVPSTCIVYGIARFGCLFVGCCHGVPASWGVFSYVAQANCFPIQFFESITSLLIGIIMIYLAYRKDYRADGSLYPLLLIVYGANRFIWEFFSASPRIFCGITELGIWAFGTMILGILWFVIHMRKNGMFALTGK